MDLVFFVEEYLDEFAESGRVIVSDRLGVAEGLQDWVGVEDSLFYVLKMSIFGFFGFGKIWVFGQNFGG